MALPTYLLGSHLTAITVASVSVDASGTWTVGAANSIRAYIQTVDGTLSNETEDIRPVWEIQQNNVRVGVGNSLRIGALQNSAAANLLVTLAAGFTYCQVAWTQGASTFTGKYIIGSLGYGVNARGANLNTLDLLPVNDGSAANVAVT